MHLYTVHRSHKLHFSATFSLKMGPTVLFTHLKIILLQCFQFSVFSFSKISSIQTHPILIELSILFMLFWWKKIKTRENILMICFIFYLSCLNDKEKRLKLSIYKKKIQFSLSLGIWIPTSFKDNLHSYWEGFKGRI